MNAHDAHGLFKESRARAQAVHDALAADPQPEDETGQRLAQQLEEHARALMALIDDSITVGLVGRFSAGKTLLLGAVLGKPDLLPVELRPTTGNVTALYLKRGEPGSSTALGSQTTVQYMSPLELSDCIRYMAQQLVSDVRKALPDADTSSLESLDPLAMDWAGLSSWAKHTLWESSAGNAALRGAAEELLRLGHALAAGPSLVGARVPTSPEVVKAALDLGDPPTTDGGFPVRSGPAVLNPNTIGADRQAMHASFPLIARVSYEVLLPPDVWEVGELPSDQQLVLLDFPGLGAGRSQRRDEFLSRRELAHVAVIVIVDRVEQPGEGEPLKFQGFLQSHRRKDQQVADAVLLAGTKFDVVPVPALPTAVPATTGWLVDSSQRMAGFHDLATQLLPGHPGRACVVSAVRAIDVTGMTYSDLSPQSRQEIDQARKQPAASPAQWQALRSRLAKDDPYSPWATWLADYADDAGIPRLRSMITAHVQEHGLAQKTEAVDRLRQQMEGTALRLARALTPLDGSRTVETDQLSARFNRLRNDLMAMLEDIRTLHNPMKAQVTDAGDALLAEVRDSAIQEIMLRPEWQRLLHNLEGDYVRKGAAPQGPANDLFLPQDDDLLAWPQEREIDTTTAFAKAFAVTVRGHVMEGSGRLLQWLREWTANAQDRLAEHRTWYESDETQDLLDRLLPSMEHGEIRRSRFAEAVTLDRLRTALGAAQPRCPLTDEAIGLRFPLRHDHALPWHHAVYERPGVLQDALPRHQINTAWMRRQLAVAAADLVIGQMAEQLKGYAAAVERRLSELHQALPAPGELRHRGTPGIAGAPGRPGPDSPRAGGGGTTQLQILLDEWGIDR
ncbi:hypothetical protein AB0M39_11745 [Streptomyces sp. NPDC051907]|uniref:hypothetical protein n=1 Tax=Streptomyces sp. NPDC051907 TaxID=3155284 RepID=UPI003436003B